MKFKTFDKFNLKYFLNWSFFHYEKNINRSWNELQFTQNEGIPLPLPLPLRLAGLPPDKAIETGIILLIDQVGPVILVK